MAPFCPGSALHIHPAPVLVKGQEKCICLSNQLAELVLEKRRLHQWSLSWFFATTQPVFIFCMYVIHN